MEIDTEQEDEMNDTPLERFTREYQRDEVIFEENSFGNEMYIVHSGKVKLFTRGDTGDEVTVSTVEKGGFFGEMTLIDGSPRSTTAVAEEDTCLITLDKPKFFYMVQQQPRFAFTIMHTLCERIRGANLLLAKVKGKEAPE